MKKESFAAVISAAGLSSRMGDFKPLMTLEGIPNIVREIRTLRECGVGEIFLVTGHRAEDIRKTLAEAFPGEMGHSIFTVFNPAYASTQMLDSLRLGLTETRADGIFVVPVDVPLFTVFTVRRLQRAFAEDPGHSLFVPEYRDKPYLR